LETDIERLLILFRRSRTLPELSGTAMRLTQLIDHEDASVGEIEKIICTDAGLAIRVLQTSNSLKFAGSEPTASIRTAILRLGLRSVKAVALSFILHDLVSPAGSGINMGRYVYHSIFVALLARYIYVRRKAVAPFASEWSADEVFAAGVLHDMHLPILARVAPAAEKRCYAYAMRAEVTIEEAFERLYGVSVAMLGSAAAETWNLPDLFSRSITGLRKPWDDSEQVALSCLAYAEYLAACDGVTTEEWPVKASIAPDVEIEVQLPQEEIADLLTLLHGHAKAYLDEAHLAVA
jgi:HD-like signal output (HDOD) protein